MCMDLHEKCSLLLSGCNKFGFSRQISNNIQTSNFIKILPVVAELFSVAGERQSDIMKLTVAFRKFENVPKNSPK